MGGPREAVDAAMLAAPVGVDRTVERNVGRLVEIENRTRGFLGNFGAQLGGRAVDRLALVTPVAIRLARGQVEADTSPLCAPLPLICSMERNIEGTLVGVDPDF